MRTIKCSVKPATPEQAFIAKRAGRGGLYLGSAPPEPCPVGLNVNSTIIFDMRADGRVLGIEFLARVGGSLMSPRVAGQIADKRFHSLLLFGASGALSAADAAFNLQHKGRDWIGWTFGKPEKPKRYWLGGGGFADVEEDILVGIGIQFQP